MPSSFPNLCRAASFEPKYEIMSGFWGKFRLLMKFAAELLGPRDISYYQVHLWGWETGDMNGGALVIYPRYVVP